MKIQRANLKDIIKRSSHATCGVLEREVVVKKENVLAVKRKLKSSGFNIIGTSEPGRKTRKIWFITQGGF